MDAPETEDSFHANSVIKSDAVHQFTGSITLADDSGLAVEALDGAPAFAARYVAGSDQDRYLALLKAMENKSDRQARFVACLSIIGLPENIELPDLMFFGTNRWFTRLVRFLVRLPMSLVVRTGLDTIPF